MRVQFTNLSDVGVVKDLAAHRLPIPGWTDAKHIRFLPDGPTTMQSDREVFSAAPIQPFWLGQFPPLVDPLWIYASDSAIYSYQGSAGTHLSLGSGFVAAGERWQGFVFQGVGIFNQVNNQPQRLAPITHGTAVVALDNWASNPGGSGTRCQSLRPYRNFLIAISIVESGVAKPFRVRWSAAAEPGTVPNSWAALPTNESGDKDIAETSDVLVDGLVLGDSFMLYKERSFWGMQYVGGQDVMRTWKISEDAGLLGRDCVTTFPGGHFVVTQDDIIVHQGVGGSIRSILKDKLRLWLRKSINALRIKNCFVCTNHPQKEVWFFFPSGEVTYANKVLCWSWENDKVTIRDVAETPFASAGSIKLASGTDIWSGGF